MTRIAWWSLLAAVFLIPVTLPTLVPFGIEKTLLNDPFSLAKLVALRVFTLIALAAWSCGILLRGGTVKRTSVDWLILAFIVWAGFTTVVSIHPATAFIGKYHRDEGFLSLLNYGAIYFVTLQLVDRADRVRTLALALFGSSVIVSTYGALQYFGLDPVSWNVDFGAQRAFSTYGNPDILGGFLVIALPVALALALSEEVLAVRLAYWAGFLLTLFTLIVSFTRGAWVGAAVALVAMVAIAWRHRVRLRQADAAAPTVGLLAGAALVAAQSRPDSSADFPLVEFGAQRLLEADAGGIGARLMIWETALKAVSERPLLGYGADTFRYVFPRFKPLEYARDISDNVADSVHNHPLQTAAGTGLIGLALLYAVFAWVAIRTAPLVFGRRDDGARLVYASFWAASAGYLANLLFGISIPGITFLLWISLGLLLAPTASSVRVERMPWGTAAAAAVVTVAVVGILVQGPVLAADAAYLTSRQLGSAPAAIDAAEQAVRLNPLSLTYREHVGLVRLERALQEIEQAEQTAQTGGNPDRLLAAAERSLTAGEQAMRETIDFAPDDYPTYQYLSALLNIRGDLLGDESSYEEVRAVAQEGMVLDPYASEIRAEYAYALRALGQRSEAMSVLESSLADIPGHDRSALILAGIFDQSGEREEALRVLRDADAAKPGQPAIEDAITTLERGESLLEQQ